MIDNFSILLSHILIAIMFYLLLSRDDLDVEDPPIPDKESDGFGVRPSASLKKQKQAEGEGTNNPMRPKKNIAQKNTPKNSSKNIMSNSEKPRA